MDYEKLYKEALERAREKYAMFEGMNTGNVLEDVFPQLRESEDERIRKALIDYFNDAKKADVWCNGLHPDGILTWLEKQGEQNPAWSEEDEDLLTSIEDSLSDYLDYIREDKTLTTQGMVKLRVLIYVEWLKSFKDRVQPKQEWSEEDEGFFNDVIAFLEDARDCRQNALDCMDWLKSLKQRMGG